MTRSSRFLFCCETRLGGFVYRDRLWTNTKKIGETQHNAMTMCFTHIGRVGKRRNADGSGGSVVAATDAVVQDW